MNKKFRFVVPFILVLMVLGLTLPACQKPATETPPAPPEQGTAGALTFEAAEYVNAEYGFSVKYPKDWVQQQNTPGIVFLASAAKRVPVFSVAIQDGATFTDALAANLAMQGSDINIATPSSTTLADGTPAFETETKWKAQGLGANTFSLGVQKDSKWIIVSVTTVSLLAKYDKAQFSEIVHTLTFK